LSGLSLFSGLSPLSLAHDFNVIPKAVESSRDFLLTRGKVLANNFFARLEPLIEMELRDLPVPITSA
jgi:hypothetical protein